VRPAEQRLATAVLVIGTGGSGLRAAIQLAERGTDVLLVGKRPSSDAHTTLAAGGINAALGTMDPADSWQQHAADTLKEGWFRGGSRNVRIVTENAPAGIADLERWGLPFAREPDGRLVPAGAYVRGPPRRDAEPSAVPVRQARSCSVTW
jgi:succinate dehydrogenase / fumarate reductase flavoprotein subunit